jgi:dCMP deaminase
MRSSWDETWMRVADAMAARSACTNRRVGSVIVDPYNRPVSVGYNGAPAGYQVHGSCASFCPRSVENNSERGPGYENCTSVHAEANALLFADRRDYRGGTIYVTNPCCWDCAKLVANSGVSRVVFRISEEDSHADIDTPTKFLETCGLRVDFIK